MPKIRYMKSLLTLITFASITSFAYAQNDDSDANSTKETASESQEMDMSADEQSSSAIPSTPAVKGENPAIVDIIYGDPSAPVTIIEYASFTCPHCADFEANVHPKIQENYIETGKANLIYREVYRSGADLFAASLARCVPTAQYYPMVFTLYDTVPTWLTNQEDTEGIITELNKLGVMAGLSKDAIATCLDDRDSQELMFQNSKKHMDEDDVRGTPTILVDGQTVRKWDWENLKNVIDEAVEKAGAK